MPQCRPEQQTFLQHEHMRELQPQHGPSHVAILRARNTLAEAAEPLPADGDDNIRTLARNLFSDHVFAFEFTSVLLIVAVAGTVLLTRKEKRREGDS